MTTDEKGNPLTYWGGLEEVIENRIKGINVDTGFRIEKSYSEEEVKDIMAETWIRCVGNDGNDFKELRDKILKQFKKK